MTTYNNCFHCSKETTNPKFCSKSCAAKHNNKGVRRHGKGPKKCLKCGEPTKTSQQKFCSQSCCALFYRPTPTKEKRRADVRFASAKYRAKKKQQTPADADMEVIKQIYLDCPKGYEVDHIIPISKGGLHHQDNLQYLTISENRRKGNRM